MACVKRVYILGEAKDFYKLEYTTFEGHLGRITQVQVQLIRTK